MRLKPLTHIRTYEKERKKKKTTTSKVLNTVQMIDLLPTFGMHLFVITANISFVSRSYVVALPTRILFEHNQCELHTTYYILYLCIPYYYIMRVKFMFDEDIPIYMVFIFDSIYRIERITHCWWPIILPLSLDKHTHTAYSMHTHRYPPIFTRTLHWKTNYILIHFIFA